MTHLFKLINKNVLFIVLLDFETTFSTLSKTLNLDKINKVIVDYGHIHVDDSFRFVEFLIINGEINLKKYNYVTRNEYLTIGNSLINEYYHRINNTTNKYTDKFYKQL